jgi:neutral ceramidase
MQSETLVAGFGRSDITPHPTYPSGMWMAQTHLRAAGVHRPLYANCLAFGAGDERVLLISYDLCILSPRQTAAIRARVSERTGVSDDHVWLYCTHTHAGPVTQDFYGREGADEVREYVAALPDRSAEAAESALAALRPARARGASGTSRIGVNRDLLHEGRIVTGPNPAGVTDPCVDVLRVDPIDGSPIAAVVTYGSHPTYLGPGNELVSPDYPGVTRDVFEELVGAPCMFLLSGAGNVGPLCGFESTTEFAERDGTILACEAARVFLGIDTADHETALASVIESGAPLGVVSRRPRTQLDGLAIEVRQVSLPTGNPVATVYDTAERDLEEGERRVAELRATGAPEAELQHAVQQALRFRLRLERGNAYLSQPTYDVAVRALAFGETCFVSLECEAYAELAVEIRERSPFPRTVFAAYEGSDVIYVAPARYYAPPVPMQIYNSPFGRNAARVLVDGAVDVLHTLRVSG